jgi:hypothetical protein
MRVSPPRRHPRCEPRARVTGGLTRSRLALAVALSAALAMVAGSTASATVPVERITHKATVHKVKVDPRLFGVHDNHLTSLSHSSTGSIRLWDSGTTWAQMQPTDAPPDFTRLDQIVAAAWANGTEVTFVAAMTPTWAATPGALVDNGTEPPELAAYGAFLTAVMDHYADYQGSGRPGIANYQLWNEANLATFWTGSQSQMAELVKTAYDARAASDPSVKLVSPAQVVSQPWMQKWTKSFYRLSVDGKPVWKYLDALSLQLYPVETVTTRQGTRATTPEDAMTTLRTVRAILAKDGVPASLPIWNTEINYGLRFGDARGTSAAPIPDRLQVAYVMRTYLLNAARGVGRVFWYSYDMGNLSPAMGGAPLANTLLTDPSQPSAGVRTPAGLALGRIESWMKGTLIGTTRKQPCITDANGTYTCTVRYASGMGRIYWNPYSSARVRLVTSARKKVDEFGTTAKVKGGTKLKVHYAPVLVRSKR